MKLFKPTIKKRKGQANTEAVTMIIILIVFAITAILMANILKPINTSFQNSDTITSEAKTISETVTGKYVRSMNNLTPFIVGILWIGGLVSAFLIDSHPAFMVLSIILIVFLVVFAAIMANIYDDATVTLDRTDFVLTTFIIIRLVPISLFMSASIIIVMFAKLRGGGLGI